MPRNKMPRKAHNRAADIRKRRDAVAAFPRVLIVCEGAKTERLYFEGLRDFYKLGRDSIEIVGRGANPTSIVKFAKEKYKANEKDGVPFDKVFCVFDKNSHADYKQACAQLENKESFEAITSVPCFEYWLLLHYHETTKPYEKKSGKSACDQVISELEKYLPGYRKGDKNIFSRAGKNLDTAKTNAESAFKSAQATGADNPSTQVHLLVKYLQSIAKK